MKKYVKYLLMVMVVMLSTMAIACGNDKPGSGGGGTDGPKQPTEDELFWDKDSNGIPDWQEEEVEITFATWACNSAEVVTIDTLMVDEFTKKYPNVKVTMQLVGEAAVWDENMLALLEADNLPDVFLINRLENYLPYGVLAEVTDMFNHDSDTDYILKSVKDLGLYNNKRYAVPSYIYPQFWIVNKDLLEAANVAIPSYDWTWDQMENIAKAVNNTTTHTIGIYGTAQYFYEYPKVIQRQTDPNCAWYSYGFDGTKFDYMTNAYLTAMNNMERALNAGYLVNALGSEQLLEYYGDSECDPRYSGHVGIWREASWSVKDHIPDFTFDFDIYPAPSGIGMGNTDILGVSALSAHKEAAYQLMKWMSYSEEGIVTRYKLYEDYSDELFISGNNYPYPIVDYGIDGTGVNKVWDNIPYGNTAPGLASPEYIESLRNAAIQANKEVIGWDAVDQAIGTYFAQILTGENDFASLREIIQNAADKAYSEKKAAISEQIG